MILVGSQRANARDLARHLMKDENERVVIHEIRGFAGRSLEEAFCESQAISKATRCRQHLFSLSLNPPPEETVDTMIFEDAIERVEKELGLTGQPRAIVFHEKMGMDGNIRRHAHAVWCRIDTENMRAVQLSHSHRKLQDLARQFYLENDWQMPHGFMRDHGPDPRNYTLAEWQQAKRAEKDPRQLKAVFQDCWAVSDSQGAFAQALKERGLILARGDRRGVVAVDRQGEVYAVSRWVGIKAKQVRGKIGDEESLPDVETAQKRAAEIIAKRLEELRDTASKAARKDALAAFEERARLKAEQERERYLLQASQKERQAREEAERSGRLRTGWRGLVDRLTGKRRWIEKENRAEKESAKNRDRAERQTLVDRQAARREEFLERSGQERAEREMVLKVLRKDLERLRHLPKTSEQEKDRVGDRLQVRNRRRQRDGPSP